MPDAATEPLLSVVTPVFNGAAFIAENVEVIRREFGSAGIAYELIVVSDGSVDETVEEALAAGHPEVRVFHYDRNLGKGYAVKLGLLAARGRYAGFIDSDLDLHPSELPRLLRAIEDEGLDAAIGSKRHPDSRVDYPTRRRVYSWLYQQLIRLLFQLDVRDTQVGIKVLRRELVEAVVPHLLVKRYAFDLELLAVAHDSGYGRIAELPVQLNYRFSGTGIKPLAIIQALWDTAAIFYRLKLLRYYRHRRTIVGDRTAPPALTSTVAIVGPHGAGAAVTRAAVERLERPPDEVAVHVLGAEDRNGEDLTAARLEILESAKTDLIAFVRPGVVPASNWLGALLPYLANPQVVAVGGPVLPDMGGGLRAAATAAVYESRFAAGPISRRHVPGNLRKTVDQPLDNLLVRREAAIRSGAFADAAVRRNDGDVCRRLAAVGVVLFTPDAPVGAQMPQLVRPLLRTLHAHARARGAGLGAGEGAPLAVAAPTAVALGVLLAPVLAVLPSRTRRALAVPAAVYGVGLVWTAVHAAFRHRDPRLVPALGVGAPAAHVAYGTGVLRGWIETRKLGQAQRASVAAERAPREARPPRP